MAAASGITARSFARLKGGRPGAGKVRGKPPKREAMVGTSRASSQARPAAAATAMRKAGQVGRHLRKPRITSSVTAPIAAALILKVSRASHSASSFGRKAAGSLGSDNPRSSFNWLAKMMTAMPAVKPTVTGKGII